MSELNKESMNRAAVSDDQAAQVTGGGAFVPGWAEDGKIKTTTSRPNIEEDKQIVVESFSR